MSRLNRLLSAAAALALLHGCDKVTEPTLSDPVKMIGPRAWFVHPDGRPASGASFKLLARSSTASDSIATASGVLDAEGRSQLKIPAGNYSLVVNDPAYGYSGWIDSVFASGDSLFVKTDTLRISGEIRGRIQVQPGSSPRIAWIHIARTDLFSNIGEDGRFRIGRVPAGRLQVVVATREKSYRSTSRECVLEAGDTVDLGGIDLPYAGLHAVTEVTTKIDTSTGIVHLSWKAPDDTARRKFAIYRTSTPEIQPPLPGEVPWKATTLSQIADTLFTRNWFSAGPGNSPSIAPWSFDSGFQAYTYWVATVGADTSTPLFNSSVRVEISSPAQKAKWKVIEEGSMELPILTNRWNFDISTMKAGIGILAQGKVIDHSLRGPLDKDNTFWFWQLDVALPDGNWNRVSIPEHKEFDAPPVFWGGRLWRLEGRRPSPDSIAIESFDSTSGARSIYFEQSEVYQSAMLFSTGDGVTWDSNEVITPLPRISRMHLLVDGINLRISFGQRRPTESEQNQIIIPVEELESADGRSWSPRKISVLPYAPNGFSTNNMSDTFRVTSNDTLDLFVIRNRSILKKMKSSIDDKFTTTAIYDFTPHLEMKASGNFFAANVDYLIGIAKQPDLSDWQLILEGNAERLFHLDSDRLYTLEGRILRRFRIQ